MKILRVEQQHVDRASAFCMAHRHASFLESEIMDDLATEFEKVAREAREKALDEAEETRSA